MSATVTNNKVNSVDCCYSEMQATMAHTTLASYNACWLIRFNMAAHV